ncbi:MAG: hypothetical protein ABF868_02740 [Sporolactobacillus sp.]
MNEHMYDDSAAFLIAEKRLFYLLAKKTGEKLGECTRETLAYS